MKYHFCDILMQFFGLGSAIEPNSDTFSIFFVRPGGDLAQVRRPIRPGLSRTAQTNQHVAEVIERLMIVGIEHDRLLPLFGRLFESPALRGDDTQPVVRAS